MGFFGKAESPRAHIHIADLLSFASQAKHLRILLQFQLLLATISLLITKSDTLPCGWRGTDAIEASISDFSSSLRPHWMEILATERSQQVDTFCLHATAADVDSSIAECWRLSQLKLSSVSGYSTNLGALLCLTEDEVSLCLFECLPIVSWSGSDLLEEGRCLVGLFIREAVVLRSACTLSSSTSNTSMFGLCICRVYSFA